MLLEDELEYWDEDEDENIKLGQVKSEIMDLLTYCKNRRSGGFTSLQIPMGLCGFR